MRGQVPGDGGSLAGAVEGVVWILVVVVLLVPFTFRFMRKKIIK